MPAPRRRRTAGKLYLELFNLHRALKSEGTMVIVTEGFFDVMKIHQAGFPHVVGLMGASLSEVQEQLLVQHFNSVVLMCDEDEAGWKVREEAAQRLLFQVFVKGVVLGEKGMQPDMLSEEKIQQLLR